MIVLESHNSSWLFDEGARQFRRVARDGRGVGEWRPYDRLIVEPELDAFIVFLDSDGTRVLRGRSHREPCHECEITQEFSLDAIRSLTTS
jgi:hypothetical protein